VLAVGSALPVAVRRLWPVAALGAVTVLTAAGMALGATHLQPLSMIFMMYTAGQRTSRRAGLWLLGDSLLVIVAGAAAAAARPGPSGPNGNEFSFIVAQTFNSVALGAIVITACWATGYAVRQQLAYQAGRREQAEQRARDQIAEARRASSEERLGRPRRRPPLRRAYALTRGSSIAQLGICAQARPGGFLIAVPAGR
jgi:hypothetical protein